MQIDFDKMDGLTPAIVQEDSTGQVLMVGFMNAEAYTRTAETGYVTFYSRTRQKLWMKGETSGNRLRVISALTDCDQDTVLFRVLWKAMGWSATPAQSPALPSRLQSSPWRRNDEAARWSPQRKFAGINDCSAQARGIERLYQQPLLFCRYR